MVRFYGILASIILLLTSCSSRNDAGVTTVLKEVNKSLKESGFVANLSASMALEKLTDQSKEPETEERATKWLAKVKRAMSLSDSLVFDIEKIKSHLIDEAGFDPEKEDNPKPAKEAVRHVFNEHKEGELLHEKLALYKRNILSIDTLLDYLKDVLTISGSDMISSGSSFTERYFNTNLLGAITMLNKIKNEIQVAKSKVAIFCGEQIGSVGDAVYSYNPLIYQSSSIVQPGENIQIKAGIGYYHVVGNTVIKIAGKQIGLNSEGYSRYDFKAPSEPGVYRVPVVVKFRELYSKKEVVVEQVIKYTVKSN